MNPYKPLKRVKFAELHELATVAADAPAPKRVKPIPAIVISSAPVMATLVTPPLIVPPIMIPTDPVESTAPKVPMARAEADAEAAEEAEEDLTKKEIGLLQCTAWLEQMTHAPRSTAVRAMRKRGDQILPLFYAENASHMTLLSALSNEQVRLRSIPERCRKEEAMLQGISCNIAYLSRTLNENWKRVERYHTITQILDQ